MTDSQRRWLTEYIGECWHEWDEGDPDLMGCHCKKCNVYRPWKSDEDDQSDWFPEVRQRTFTTWADLGAVMEAIQKKGEWDSFDNFSYHEWRYNNSSMESFTPWLFHPAHFCGLLCRCKGWSDG